MKPKDAADALAARTAHLKDVPADAVADLERAARDAAGKARAAAARAHHSLSVRIVPRNGGIRITVQGQHAARYRTLIESELDARIPGLKAEIRTKAIGKSR